MDPRYQAGFLGTNAPLIADLSLLAYVLLIAPSMLIGFFFARRKMFEPHHKYMMTTITLINWVIIVFLMIVSYSRSVAPQIPEGLSQITVILPTIHLITGALAQLLATYLVARMWLPLPAFLKIKKIKTPMRITLTLWLVTAALGVLIYVTWYMASPVVASGDAPVATPEATPESTPESTPDVLSVEATEESMIAPVATEEAVIVTPEMQPDPEPVETPELENEPVETPEVSGG
jgi:uncharacterized membrane protein YozB (DUF420 family)